MFGRTCSRLIIEMCVTNGCFFCHNEEMDPQCQQLISDNHGWVTSTIGFPHRRPCVHANLLDILPDQTFDSTWSFIQKLHAINDANFRSELPCLTCGQSCDLFDREDPDIDVSGLPCWDNSPSGKKRYEEGATNAVFICHAKLHVEKGTKIVIVETSLVSITVII